MPIAVATQPRRETFHVLKRGRHVPEARARVRKILADWGVGDELAADVAVVTTEYVTNAVRHCRVSFARIEVSLSVRDAHLLVEVSDPDRTMIPELRACGDQEEGGRGLVVVAALAENWGCDLRQFVKCVWATFPVPEACSSTALQTKEP
ncbi:ATP-binding protein [Streptomyces sp. NBC_01340]|uniref:ATP-binding protein n=1 Tax=unclassified Streptomyces TaxID=2593676 RepID=UPI002254AF5C|nr:MULTISPECIES: ATP-binding protein [unclassified Streptomyces]MCX4454949.1 ATP-binding protein [Streptomyces sp. NBC_01719]MCX4494309.1 ATP-binding protein [Streptomyces sp. NBC_01728]WSI39359.1 ATP-binding protein [Streptomyces sp. NBC_01340]